MRLKTAKMPAMIPTTAPVISLVTFAMTSVLASSISSRMRSVAVSVISWIAWPSSEVSVFVCHGSVEDPLEDARRDERAGEGGADQHLGALSRPDGLLGDRSRGDSRRSLRSRRPWRRPPLACGRPRRGRGRPSRAAAAPCARASPRSWSRPRPRRARGPTSSSARRASVIARFSRSSAPRTSLSVVAWVSSSLIREDLPRRPGAKSVPPRARSRPRRAPRAPRAAPPTSGA